MTELALGYRLSAVHIRRVLLLHPIVVLRPFLQHLGVSVSIHVSIFAASVGGMASCFANTSTPGIVIFYHGLVKEARVNYPSEVTWDFI